MGRGELKRQFFIAVFPPDRITGGIDRLRRKGPPEWDWKHGSDFHISLAFPGRLGESEFKKLQQALREFEFPPFVLSFKGMGVFAREPEDSHSRKHVLWARPEAEADNALRALHKKLSHFLSKRGFPYGLREITPHLTVAKAEGPPDLMEQFAAAHAGLKTPSWRCDRIELRETAPQGNGQGGRFAKVAEFRLAR